MTDGTTDGDGPTMADVDHTHPETDQAFGTVYRRGPVLADGEGPAVGRDPGTGDARADGGADESERDRMADVDHEAPHGDGARGVWERGDGAADGPRTAAVDGEDVDGAGDGTSADDVDGAGDGTSAEPAEEAERAVSEVPDDE